MRLNAEQIESIRRAVAEVAGREASVRLFGSRVDDAARGGDVDLLVELPGDVEAPAVLAARVGARVSRALGGRKVDVVIGAPNLRTDALHRIARERGVAL